jgi:quercetin dioxygenase-like cupin family protein
MLRPSAKPRTTFMKHIKWDEIPAEHVNEKFARKLAWDGKIMVGMTLVKQGYVVPLHAHDNEQVTFVESGTWRFSLENKTVDVGPGEMIFIPANVPHTAEAIATLVAYDIFTPPRRDWIEGKDSYLRSGTDAISG